MNIIHKKKKNYKLQSLDNIFCPLLGLKPKIFHIPTSTLAKFNLVNNILMHKFIIKSTTINFFNF